MVQPVALAITLPQSKHALLFLLLGLIAGFGGARTVARLSRASGGRRFRSVRHGDVHVHHVVFGVVAMFVFGVLAFALGNGSDWHSALAFVFGGSVGVALDEFALLLHVDDVYWAEAGRKSVDAAVVTTAATLMLLIGVVPVGADAGRSGLGRLASAIVAANLAAVVITALKGKRLLAVIGVVTPLVAPLAALTLARADSPWARWFYRRNPAKLERARRRAHHLDALGGRLRDIIAGTSEPRPR
jgi:hypothetical protein